MAGKALLVIDYTRDFVADDGRLSCGRPAQAIAEAIVQLMDAFSQGAEAVVLAIDLHEESDSFHPQARLYPPHNLRGSEGRRLYGPVEDAYRRLTAAHPEGVRWLDKTRYSAFAGTDLDLWLRARGIAEVHLSGVCTDICVLHTGIAAYYLGYRLVVHRRAVASFSPAGHAFALEHMRQVLGAEVVE